VVIFSDIQCSSIDSKQDFKAFGDAFVLTSDIVGYPLVVTSQAKEGSTIRCLEFDCSKSIGTVNGNTTKSQSGISKVKCF
jgi:hypothetical protein